jgi:hypothetical protein
MLSKQCGSFQATTALIGVGTVVGVILSAVNLTKPETEGRRTATEMEVKDGFIDMKKALKDQEQKSYNDDQLPKMLSLRCIAWL